MKAIRTLNYVFRNYILTLHLTSNLILILSLQRSNVCLIQAVSHLENTLKRFWLFFHPYISPLITKVTPSIFSHLCLFMHLRVFIVHNYLE